MIETRAKKLDIRKSNVTKVTLYSRFYSKHANNCDGDDHDGGDNHDGDGHGGDGSHFTTRS